MKNRNYLLYIILIFLLVLTLVGCGEKVPKPETFTVYFYNEEILLKEETVEKGGTATAPNLDIKEGYSFVGWDQDYSNVQKDIETRAVFIKTYHTITYDSNGGDFKWEINYDINESVTQYPVPNNVGLDFIGWFLDLDDEDPFNFGSFSEIDNNIILFAKWEVSRNDVYYHTNSNIIIKKDTLDYNDEINLPDLELAHYVFEGWYLDDTFTSKITEGVMKEENIHLYAKWSPVKYKVSLDVNGGDPLDNHELEVQFGDYFEFNGLPTPTNPNGEFVGWKFKDTIIDSSFSIFPIEDMTFVAEWIRVDSKYDEFNTFISQMDKWISDSKSYSLYTLQNILTNSVLLSRTEEFKTLVDKEDYYLEVIKDSNYEIIQIDGDKVFLLKVTADDGIYYVDTNYLYNIDALPNYVDLSFGNLFNKYMYYEKININHYKITANYVYEEYPGLLALLGLEEFETIDSSFKVVYEIEYDSTLEKYSINISSDDFEVYHNGLHEEKLEYIYEYYNNALDKFDLDNENLIFLQPKSMDTVKEITDISGVVESNQVPKPHFYKIELETSQYTIISDKI